MHKTFIKSMMLSDHDFKKLPKVSDFRLTNCCTCPLSILATLKIYSYISCSTILTTFYKIWALPHYL